VSSPRTTVRFPLYVRQAMALVAARSKDGLRTSLAYAEGVRAGRMWRRPDRFVEIMWHVHTVVSKRGGRSPPPSGGHPARMRGSAGSARRVLTGEGSLAGDATSERTPVLRRS
jgi:hypothetical protein